MPEKITIGIDWSMNSPSICVHVGDEWNIKNCQFMYFNGSKKRQVKTDQLRGWPVPIYDENDDLDRWTQNSKWAQERLYVYEPFKPAIGLEGYSYGSKGGLAFSIAENTAILKYTLRKNMPESIPNIFAPQAIKKFASGTGGADKQKMYNAFVEETGFDLTKIIPSKASGNPISDIVDSYFIAKLTYHELTKI